jgi:NADH:ubiquinone oxidoreductase subunit F (NADH-binding)
MSIIDALDEAGLTGRGGAAFSTGIKVRAAFDNAADLIVNACDGEIGAAKDGWVVANHLDELVEGARLVARGRRRRILFATHRGSDTAHRLHAAGLHVLETPDRYVSSEETSLISLAQGGLARPMTKRAPFVMGGRDSAGRRIKPTVVLNAETVWRVAQIADRGPQWFRSFGTRDEPGPRLVSVTGYVEMPHVVQTQAGTRVLELLDAAGEFAPAAENVLIGGLGGFFLTMEEARRARWSTADFAPYGGAAGPGILDVLDPRLCPIGTVDRFLGYAAGESAGQCGPCMFGVPAVAKSWRELAAYPTQSALDQLTGRADLLANRGACRFPDGVGRFTRSAVRVFTAHLAEHARGGCPTERTYAHA